MYYKVTKYINLNICSPIYWNCIVYYYNKIILKVMFIITLNIILI